MWPAPLKKGKSAVERQHAYLRAKLSDEDHRIHAIAQMGGVVRVLAERRGVLSESFRTMDGTDCTQSVTKLQRCALVDPLSFQREITTDANIVIATRTILKCIRSRKR